MSKVVITKERRRAILGAFALVIVAVVGLVAIVGGTTEPATADSDLPPNAFALFDGGEATFADFEGKPLVINFWASWCPACVAELPEFQSVHEQYADRVTFLGVANSDRRDAAIALADDVGLTYALADDPAGTLFTDLGLISMPSTIFVDANGRIQEVFGGQLNEPLLIERLESLVAAS